MDTSNPHLGFPGDKKYAISYDLWKYEVICLMKKSKTKKSTLQAVCRSVRGEIVNVIMRLGVGASIHDILH